MKNKILAISIIFILISFTFINSCFAYPSFDSIGDDSVGFKYKKYIVIATYEANYLYVLGASTQEALDDVEIEISQKNSDNYKEYIYFHVPNGVVGIHRFKELNYSDTTSWQEKYYVLADHTTISLYGLHSHALYSDYDIKYQDTDEYFFQITPVTEGTLAPMLEEVEMMEPTTREILTLVPIMIILIVSYLALRKGLNFLKILRKM